MPALAYAEGIEPDRYAGFNLLLTDGESLVYCSNRDGQPRSLQPGIYGLSNHLLDSPWPKLLAARQAFAEALPSLPDETVFLNYWATSRSFQTKTYPTRVFPLRGNACFPRYSSNRKATARGRRRLPGNGVMAA
jgi:uncharacterized protein with NRDE domain